MKNYKKIYKRLIKILEDERNMLQKAKSNCDCEKIRYQGGEDVLRWVLDDVTPELEGKECKMVFFNKSDFKEWKKEIKK